MFYDFFNPNTFKDFYSPEFYIDSFQNTKKIVTDKVLTDKTLNKAAHAYIDAQTAFAKVLVTNTLEIAKVFNENVAEKVLQKAKQAKAV
jgi:hypothetical protein